MKKFIELTEDNYFKALDLDLIPMDWIKRQATKGSDLLKRVDKVITYNGTILDFRNKYNAINDGYIKVNFVEELKCCKMNYNVLKELLGMLQNYNHPVNKIDINDSYADVYFESDNEEKYQYFLNLWICDMHNANKTYVRFYLKD